MIRSIAGAVLGAFLAVTAVADSEAKIVTFYDAKPGTKVRKGPGQQHPVVYTIKEIDIVKRVGKTKLYGRMMTSGVDGKPKCKGGWCEVMAGSGNFGFIPQSVLQKRSYDDSGYSLEDDPFFEDFF